ncbi:putative axonemal dynein light chain domain-containing protein 1 [Apostichopus japonicus]|uniref:Putative axonemal dynein light chain domain-containing protein 1 n=1 Tax=Stichopus japonicus TaxID=307972 RepID=A0A2G8LP99_STIJA|nr:putative axonemal dynein light chain domain-containing protein 1 [Apostichopus japonicus]
MTAAVTSMPGNVQQDKSLTLTKEGFQDDAALLPSLRASHNKVDKTKPLPTSLQSEFIPEDILSALTQLPGPSVKEKLSTPSRLRNGSHQGKGKNKSPSANLWHFPHQRKKFQHLTDQPVSLKGAGRDISFLYDVALVEPPLTKPNTRDPSTVRIKDRSKEEPMAVSETLIPSEYHIVKSKGVQQLEFQEDKYTTNLVDDEKNLVKFPSMKPTSRYEVLQLQEALEAMLEKAGVKDEEVEVKGPTQMHNLLELIKKEQNIYNIVFHELIRQTTVECSERGELLSRVRELYNHLLDKVPRQIKSLHQEVMAQRALDRRLTEELFRFKSSIAELTNELSDVKEHDKVVTSQAQQAQQQLAKALAESEKNSSLLNEYHELYELQRRRLESHVTNLAIEREQWSNAAYSLALKQIRYPLPEDSTSARKLGANWPITSRSSSATGTLNSCPTSGFIARHRELIIRFDEVLLEDDQKSHERLIQVKLGVEKWMEHFEGSIVASDHIHTVINAPSTEMIQSLYDDMRTWQQVLNKEVEKFGGDVLLTREDSLEQVQKQVDVWTETALQVFNRHKPNDSINNPNQEKLEEMIQECQQLHTQYQTRTNGENGTARGFINIQNSIESWDTKLNTILNGGPMPLEAEWSRLYELFHEWDHSIEEVDSLIGTSQKEDDRAERKTHNQIDKDTVFQDSQKWLSNTVNGIDSQDSKLVEQVSVLHADMVHWMIQVLLRLAPDPVDSPQEIVDSCMSTALSYAEIREKASTIFDHLTSFSNYISGCCVNIVAEEVQRRQDEGAEDFDHEFRDLKKLKTECAEWIHTATILMEELKNSELAKLGGSATPYSVAPIGDESREGGVEGEMPPVESRAETSATAQTRATSTASQDINMSEMQVLGHDQNVWTQSLEEPTQPPKSAGGLSVHDSSRSPNTPDTNKAYEALAAVQALQTQLFTSEERCQTAEERAAQLEDELLQTQEKLRALERKSATPTAATPQPEVSSPPLQENRQGREERERDHRWCWRHQISKHRDQDTIKSLADTAPDSEDTVTPSSVSGVWKIWC